MRERHILCPSPLEHYYMVTFPAACCGERYREMVVFTHTRVKDVGSDGTVRVDVLWNEPKSGGLNGARGNGNCQDQFERMSLSGPHRKNLSDM